MKLATEYFFTTAPSGSPSGGSVFVRGVSNVYDTFLNEAPLLVPDTTNYGNTDPLQVGGLRNSGTTNDTRVSRILLGFDLSSIPAGSTITSAVLTMTNAGNGALTDNVFNIKRVTTTGWTETGANWNSYDGVTNWTSPGGDSTASTTWTAGSAASNMSVDISSLITDAINNRNGFASILISANTEIDNTHSNILYFYSSENATPANRPTLTVVWTAPLNAVPRTQSYASGYDSTKVNVGQWIQQKGGPTFADNYAGPVPITRVNPGDLNTSLILYAPFVLDVGNNIHWVFQIDFPAAATRKVVLSTYNTSTQAWGYKGHITLTYPPAVTENIAGFKVARHLYTTGTVAVSGTAVTGTNTAWQSAKYAAGARIGFGSTDPNAITQWYYISTIANDTSITLSTSAGTISSGAAFVIDELRIYSATFSSAPTTNGGLFVAKGVNFDDFVPNGTTISAATSADNIKAVYWLADATTLTNTVASGLALGPQTDNSQYAYVIDNVSSGNFRVFKYDVRAALTSVSSGKSTQAFVLRTATIALPNGSTLPTQTYPVLATTNHGPGSGVSCLYLHSQTPGRIIRMPEASIVDYLNNNVGTNPIADFSIESPPGSAFSFPLAATFSGLGYDSVSDRFIVGTNTTNFYKQIYVTKYSASGDAYDRAMFSGNFVQNNLGCISDSPIFTNWGNVSPSFAFANGMLYIMRTTATLLTATLYAIPLSADWDFAAGSSAAYQNRLIMPSMATSNCSKFYKVAVQATGLLGINAVGFQTEPYRVYARTNGIVDDSGDWTLLPDNGDLSSFLAAENIQFMFEFKVIGALGVPARIYGLTCTYEDNANSRYFQPSEVLSIATTKTFAWRISTAFNTSIPALTVKYLDAVNGGVVLTDTTSKPTYGTFYKSTDGSTWVNYNAADRTNETTYIRYTPSSFPDNIKARAVLNLSKDGLTANFSASPTSGASVIGTGLTVTFTDLTMGNKPPTGWSWTFGDGNTSTAQNPSNTYYKSGTYSITLTVTNADSSSTYTRSNYITVTDVLDAGPRWGVGGDPTAAVVAHGEGPEWTNGGGYYDVSARIPTIIKAPDGSLLLFFQGSQTTANDYGVFALRCKRSTDNGVTWSAATDVVNNADYQNNNAAASFGYAGTWLALGAAVTDSIGMGGNPKSVNLLYTYHNPCMYGKSTYALNNTVAANVATVATVPWTSPQPVTFTGTSTFGLDNTLNSGSIVLTGGSNGWASGQRIKFTGGGNAYGLDATKYYYICKTAADKFKVCTNANDALLSVNFLTLSAGTGTNQAQTGPFGLMPNFVYWLYIASSTTFKVYTNSTDATTNTGSNLVTLTDSAAGSTCSVVQAADGFQIFNVRSTDNGVTWGAPTEITTDVNNSALTYTFTASTATNLITFSTTPSPALNHGQAVSFTNSGGALPAPLLLVGYTGVNNNFIADKAYPYYLYMNSATTATIYTTYADALSNTGSNKVTLTSNGSGTNTVNFIYYWMAPTVAGIQLSSTSSNPGRLVVPFDHRTGGVSGSSYMHCIKSDDGGVTWSVLGGSTENAGGYGANETALIETKYKDRLYVNSRNVGGGNGRIAAISFDGGVSWSNMGSAVQIPTSGGTQVAAMLQSSTLGSMIRLNDLLVVASPSDYNAGTRMRMSLWTSSDEGLTWTFQKTLHYRHVSYSGMVALDNERFMIVFEATADNSHGTSTWYGGNTMYMAPAVINKNWLTSSTTYQYSDYYFNDMRSDQMTANCICNPLGSGFVDYGYLNAPAGAVGTSAPTYAGSSGGVILAKDKVDAIVLSSPIVGGSNIEFQVNTGESITYEIEATITDNGVLLSNLFGNRGVQLESSSGNLKVTLKDGTNTTTVTGSSTITGAGRQTYAFVRDAISSLVKLYINGVLEASVADTTGDLRVVLNDSSIGYPQNCGMWIGQSPMFQFNVQGGGGVDTTNDVITLQATHGWSDGQAVMVTSDHNIPYLTTDANLPAPLTIDTIYYIRNGATGSNDAYKVYLYDSSAHAIAGGGTGLVNLTTTGGGGNNVNYMTAVATASPYTLGATIWSARVTRGVVAPSNLIQPNRTKVAPRTYRGNFTPTLPTYNSSYTPLNISSLHTWLYATAYNGEGMYADNNWGAHGNNPLPWPNGSSFKSQRDQTTNALFFNSGDLRNGRYFTSDANVGPYCQQLYNHNAGGTAQMVLSPIHNKNIYDFIIGSGPNGNCKWSIAMAVKFNSDVEGAAQYLVDTTYDAGTAHNGVIIYKDTSGKINVLMSTASTFFANVTFSALTISLNTWYFIMVVSNGYSAAMNFYYQTLNGSYVYNNPYNSATNCSVQNSAAISSVTPGTTFGYMNVGGRGDLVAMSDISIKNFMIFNNSLSSTDADNLARYCVSA